MAKRHHKKPQPQPLLRLADAARHAGVTVNQLQYYLYMLIIKPTKISPGNQRLFDSRAVRLIRTVKLLNLSGYPLREIREIFLERRYKATAKSRKTKKKKRN